MNRVCANCLHTNPHKREIQLEGDEPILICSKSGCSCTTLKPLEPGDVVVTFGGFMVINNAEVPDDPNFEDIALDKIAEVMQDSVSVSQTIKDLHMTVTTGEVGEPKSHVIRWGKP